MNRMASDRRKYHLKARAERQRQTRERIVAAAESLHREVGPARTTIADIARRAGVQRLTVYNTFPRPEQLFAACQGRFLMANPPPELRTPAAHEDPVEAFEANLRRLYAWYRANEAMQRNVYRDRGLIPELDTLLQQTADAGLDQAAKAWARAIAGSTRASRKTQTLIRLALDFRTWETLREKESDAGIAQVLAHAVQWAALGRDRV